jgi:hypothetical protein
VSSRSRGAAVASAAADLIGSLSALIVSLHPVLPPSVSRGAGSAIGRSSRTSNREWFPRHRLSAGKTHAHDYRGITGIR